MAIPANPSWVLDTPALKTYPRSTHWEFFADNISLQSPFSCSVTPPSSPFFPLAPATHQTPANQTESTSVIGAVSTQKWPSKRVPKRVSAAAVGITLFFIPHHGATPSTNVLPLGQGCREVCRLHCTEMLDKKARRGHTVLVLHSWSVRP